MIVINPRTGGDTYTACMNDRATVRRYMSGTKPFNAPHYPVPAIIYEVMQGYGQVSIMEIVEANERMVRGYIVKQWGD